MLVLQDREVHEGWLGNKQTKRCLYVATVETACLSSRIGKFRRVLALEEADQEGFEEEGYYYHQRKRGDPKSRAQQQLRELEGKERLERSRVERRLKLTQSIRQGMLHGNQQPPLLPLLTPTPPPPPLPSPHPLSALHVHRYEMTCVISADAKMLCPWSM